MRDRTKIIGGKRFYYHGWCSEESTARAIVENRPQDLVEVIQGFSHNVPLAMGWQVWRRKRPLDLASFITITELGPDHRLVKVERRGRIFAEVYAQPFPSLVSAWSDYRHDPKAFRPYDESAGRFLK
jgi:hypothetical protein